ncbi:MAG TPA: LytR C-terminal domain-containing protein, partial [Demequinaceae bacterium]
MDKPTSSTSKFKTRREILRRHRRERQVLFFGIVTIALGAVGYGAYSIYTGTMAGPFSAPFVTKAADFKSTITLPCPPADALPMATGDVLVRVFNGTDRAGLAGAVLTDLTGRGYYGGGAGNWSRTYAGTARISFGVDGIREAYTVARNFVNPEFILDTRPGVIVDVVVGADYSGELVALADPSLDPTVPLEAPGPCEKARLITPEPAPKHIPVDPRVSASPSPSPSP